MERVNRNYDLTLQTLESEVFPTSFAVAKKMPKLVIRRGCKPPHTRLRKWYGGLQLNIKGFSTPKVPVTLVSGTTIRVILGDLYPSCGHMCTWLTFLWCSIQVSEGQS